MTWLGNGTSNLPFSRQKLYHNTTELYHNTTELYHNTTEALLEDSDAVVGLQPLETKVPVLNPVMNRCRLWDFKNKQYKYWLRLQEADIECD